MKSYIYYDTICKSYSKLYHLEQINKIKQIQSFLEVKNKKILDLGCGDGVLNKFIEKTNKIYSADNSKNMLKLNKNKNKFLVDLNSQKLPFENNFFDMIICLSVFQDLENFKILKEIQRVIKENSIIIISHIKISKKKKVIENEIKKFFEVCDIIEEEKDLIYILKKFYKNKNILNNRGL